MYEVFKKDNNTKHLIKVYDGILNTTYDGTISPYKNYAFLDEKLDTRIYGYKVIVNLDIGDWFSRQTSIDIWIKEDGKYIIIEDYISRFPPIKVNKENTEYIINIICDIFEKERQRHINLLKKNN